MLQKFEDCMITTTTFWTKATSSEIYEALEECLEDAADQNDKLRLDETKSNFDKSKFHFIYDGLSCLIALYKVDVEYNAIQFTMLRGDNTLEFLHLVDSFVENLQDDL